tara:strand:- start:1421 stop:1879 length:459 start_codon:yes stop_codon:yes gene_type:complete
MYFIPEIPVAPVIQLSPPTLTEASAEARVRSTEDAWNSRDPEQIARFYTPDSLWRERAESFRGRREIRAFLKRKWQRELDFKLHMDLWSFTKSRIAVSFCYEWHDDSGNWFRTHGTELWHFCDRGRISQRIACMNDEPIHKHDRILKEIGYE